MPLATREAVVASMRRAMLANIDRLSRMAVDETGLGRVEDKVRKNRLAAISTPGTEDLRPIAYSGDHGLTLVERAPYGVIGSITPSTNPTETIICNAIGMVAGGNVVVFNPHPSARAVSLTCIDLLNRAIAEAGGPRALLLDGRLAIHRNGAGPDGSSRASGCWWSPADRGWSGRPCSRARRSWPRAPATRPSSWTRRQTSRRQDATSSRAPVSTTTSSASRRRRSVAVRSIVPALKAAMTDAGGVEVKGRAAERLTELDRRGGRGDGASPRRSIAHLIGKDVGVILAAAGLPCPAGARIAFFEADSSHPLVWSEQMMPVIPLVTVETADDGDRLRQRGRARIRTHGRDALEEHRQPLKNGAGSWTCSIFVKNGPSYAGLGFGGEGFTTFTIASPTGEGLTRATTFTRERRCTLVDYFRISLARVGRERTDQVSEATVTAIQKAGVVGAGGGGFPSHVKAGAYADIVLANGAECEPLLRADCRTHVARPGTGRQGPLASPRLRRRLARRHRGQDEERSRARSTRGRAAGRRRRGTAAALDNVYPAGDEFLLVFEATGRVVPEGGIPLDVGVVVNNVTTLAQVADAVEGRPVDREDGDRPGRGRRARHVRRADRNTGRRADRGSRRRDVRRRARWSSAAR